MTQQDERIKYFAEDEVPLPMHMLLVEEMLRPRFDNRFYESKVARTMDYDCHGFYKHISRPLLLDPEREDES